MSSLPLDDLHIASGLGYTLCAFLICIWAALQNTYSGMAFYKRERIPFDFSLFVSSHYDYLRRIPGITEEPRTTGRASFFGMNMSPLTHNTFFLLEDY